MCVIRGTAIPGLVWYTFYMRAGWYFSRYCIVGVVNGMERAKDKAYLSKGSDKSKKGIEERFSYKVINFILRYKDSRTFAWIGNHHDLAMLFLVLWGILILFIFLWFIFSRFLH